jgi:hypothetical protein
VAGIARSRVLSMAHTQADTLGGAQTKDTNLEVQSGCRRSRAESLQRQFTLSGYNGILAGSSLEFAPSIRVEFDVRYALCGFESSDCI